MSHVGLWSSSFNRFNLPSIRELGLDHLLHLGLPPLPDIPGMLSPRPVKDSQRFVNRADRHVSLGLPPLRPHHTVEAEYLARLAFGVPSDAPVFTSHSPAKVGPRAVHSPGLESSRQRPRLICSLDVLRLDSSKASLNHLSSSMIFASGAAISETIPISMVILHLAPPTCTSIIGPQSPGHRERSSPTTNWVYPRSIHPSATRVSFLIDGMNYAIEHPEKLRRVSKEEFKRRKHVCPRCLMRFSRPSSVDIHLNSHTGATPFRCPYPNCGRQFSVKSNMLRHYRCHSRATTLGYSNRHRRRHNPPNPPGFVAVDPIIFKKVPIEAPSVESSQSTSSRAVSPLSSGEVALHDFTQYSHGIPSFERTNDAGDEMADDKPRNDDEVDGLSKVIWIITCTWPLILRLEIMVT